MTVDAPEDRPAEHAKPLRVFYALWPDAVARDRLAALAAAVARDGGGRAIAAANLHVTLAFVGNVPAADIDALREVGAAAARGVGAIALSLDKPGGARDGELAWIAPGELPANLVQLHARLDAGLAARGFPTEQREFRPHVTLARRCVRRARRAPPPPIAWTIDALTLMASTTTPDGSHYREIGRWRLDGP